MQFQKCFLIVENALKNDTVAKGEILFIYNMHMCRTISINDIIINRFKMLIERLVCLF